MQSALRSAAILSTLAAIAACGIQASPPPAHYARLFPSPTGRNAYEDFARAADLSNSSKPWQEYERTGNDSLDLKRRILADPLCRQAMEAVSGGLKKPIIYPHTNEEMTTLLPEMRDFRSVGRLIKTEMEVRLADGETIGALDSFADGLHFGRSVQCGGLTSAVVGLLVENTIIDSFARHLGRLNLQDCSRLIGIVKREARRDAEPGLVSRERDIYARTFRNHRSDAPGLMETLDPGPNASKLDRSNFLDVRQMLREHPDQGPGLMDSELGLVNAHYTAILNELKRPAWKRTYAAEQNRDTPAAKLLFSLCPRSYARYGDRFAAERTRLQLLAAHAAVIRYRIQQKHYPNSVNQLNLGPMATDLFTGRPLQLTALGGGDWQISSAGPCEREEGNSGPSGRRTPIAMKFLSRE